MHCIKPVVFCLILAGAMLPAAVAFADGGESGGDGGGERGGGGGDRGGGGGAPAPLLGLTLLGQVSGAAGVFAA